MNSEITSNPLLDLSDLPLFDAIVPEHVEPAIGQLLKDANTALETVTQEAFPAEWSTMSATLDVATERLGRAWGAVSHLNSVADTPALRAAYNKALPAVTDFWTRLGSDERLYAKYKAMDPTQLNAEQTQAHFNSMRGFVLGGADLQGEAKTRFAWLQERQAELGQKFSENALDATDGFSLVVPSETLKGVPSDVLQATAEAAKADGLEGHKLTLKLPCYFPVMQFADDAGVREKLYKAYVTRASDQAPEEFQKFDNTAIMTELLALRHEEAKLLGYRHYADVSVVLKMAESPEQVISFLRDLAHKARPFAEQDLADLRAFAATDLGLKDPQPWDWAYVGEKLKEARYAFSEQEVKRYFPLDKVLAGLFQIVETLFEVAIRPDQGPVWHPQVKLYRIERATANGPQLVGQFYLDPSARNGKRGGAWMDDVRARWLRPDTGVLQTPVAHLVCNFAEGVQGKPALLTHDDVITLFHEFGHGLHHMLTQVNERDVSGISGVEWDAVELPSQFMENFCWEWDVIKHMTSHVDTGESLPRALFDKMLAAKNFQSGMQTLRQVEFSLFDMQLHGQPEAVQDGDAILGLLNAVRDEVAVLKAPVYSRTVQTFSHIFAGGYSAGYYSYKWAEVLSADAYAAFEEAAQKNGTSTVDVATGRRYREAILEAGGSRPAMASFKAFRGREPEVEALLRHQGMA
ncbi:M3 family metallopeptidase [Hydrogenophaga sp. PAMC20947]|uniref:M3 family metallopeptidase n=1 Tax=Hydrogenophaga sp. PAMC20947 TaxID=2565558 RepID=UPI00109D8877|nr:M3 family metallopeptidase [Hydrogenophaga sp. PAMC20947]QCB45673.1 M3 family peptidase [Hydrogenophaga sp. PAMC20947]